MHVVRQARKLWLMKMHRLSANHEGQRRQQTYKQVQPLHHVFFSGAHILTKSISACDYPLRLSKDGQWVAKICAAPQPWFNRSMTATTEESVSIISELTKLAAGASSADALMDSIVSLLHEKLTRYNWVGFYMIDPHDANMLVLGPFRGSMTPHTRIPLNQGICGAAASSGQTVVVDDVNNDARYLACSLETKSEIVVPVFANGKVVGELDIDSHFLAVFGPDDRKLCEHAAVLVGKYLETGA